MKKLPITFAILALALIAAAPAKAPQTKEPVPVKEPVKKDYENIISKYEILSKNFSSEEYYSKKKIMDGDKEIKLKDYDKLQKDVFFVMRGEQVTKSLKILQGMFEKFKVSAENREKTPKPKEEEKKEEKKKVEITSAEIEKYIEQLVKLRKDHALRFEAFIEVMFKKHKEKIPEVERKLYLKLMKKWHDDNKLIDRK